MTCSEQQARALEKEKGYSVAQDGDSGWRRVVASPTPLKIMNVCPFVDIQYPERGRLSRERSCAWSCV